MGMDWRQAITALSAGGIFAGFDPVSGGFALLDNDSSATPLSEPQSLSGNPVFEAALKTRSANESIRGFTDLEKIRLDVVANSYALLNGPVLTQIPY